MRYNGCALECDVICNKGTDVKEIVTPNITYALIKDKPVMNGQAELVNPGERPINNRAQTFTDKLTYIFKSDGNTRLL
ncbi:hypothetical protein [endosymbiont 'TC1' of Trimyema compressum]|uniref:hypothetical protein n=1 Tax=endosymbiont 'TC1' of Trimyema compressum TaxID=243899 RepID=UPI0013922345|nr:hypothetical protein [endosymbiont 'TC1' of Trimyema compressum]